MARFDRYMLSQLMMLFGFFSLVLVLIYWINRAVVLFDQLIADGQSATVFLEFTALTLPSVMQLALPLAAFAASVYVTHRMTTESELVVVQATGYSPFRLARPVLYFGLIVALLLSVLNHFLAPLSRAQFDQRQSEIAQNITARLLTEGQFLEPVDGVTFYIRDISPQGELMDVFISDNRAAEEHVTYTASRSFLVGDARQTQLVMIDGTVQNLRLADQRLFTTSFEEFAYDIGSLIGTSTGGRRKYTHLSTWELLQATPEVVRETRSSQARLLAEGHDRFAEAILGVVAALLGFAALLIGNFSRFGVWWQILVGILLIIVIKAVETAGVSAARQNAHLWAASYAANVVGFAVIWFLLFWAGRPYLFKRRLKDALAQ